MEKLVGTLNNIIFESENNYNIASFNVTVTNEDCIICGYFQKLIHDITYEIEGNYVEHPKHGKQLSVTSVKKRIENTEDGIVEYLSSSFFHGIGPSYAKEIFSVLGPNCLSLIEQDKNVLEKVNIPYRLKESLYDSLIRNKSLEELFVKMFDSGLSNKMLLSLYDKYYDKTLETIYDDPYHLIEILDGYGFRKADMLGKKLSFSILDTKRIEALILYTLYNLSDMYGMSYVTKLILFNNTYKNGFVNEIFPTDLFENCLQRLEARGKIKILEDKVYLFNVYHSELSLSEKLKKLNSKKTSFKKNSIIEMLDSYQKANNITFSSDQVLAIESSLLNKVSIITGGPGTGKTTIIKAIIEIFSLLKGYNINDEKASIDIQLVAPTGKAAKRLREKCNFTANTIHRALGYDLEGNFAFNDLTLLPSKLIIIDEVSMIDLVLANNLVRSIPIDSIVIFVGDHNQLPSIACGDVLNDLITSNIFNVTTLNTIYRQKNNSGIVELAKMVNNGCINEDVFKDNNDLHFISCRDDDVYKFVLKYIEIAIKQGYDLLEDITVLAPMYKGVNGIDNINELVSEKFNKEYSFEIEFKEKKYKENDKVIQLVNSKELQIFNGDIGVINNQTFLEVDGKQQEMVNVIFDGKRVKLLKKDFENIKLAYATSIHKSQGSEYKVVIMPISKSHNIMLKRKLLYTGITRAKEKLIIIGDYNVFLNGVDKVEDKRYTTLSNKLNDKIEEVKVSSKQVIINDVDIPFDTLGEINMENITPYSFME